MKYDEDKLMDFCRTFYDSKDIMHNMWHLQLVKRWVERLIEEYNYSVDKDLLIPALYFHGFIYSHQSLIEEWLNKQGYSNEEIKSIVNIAWESQRPEVPETFEGKVLHDAHVLEGGKTYAVVKTLITGSVRGQSLLETVDYLERNVIDKNTCYLPETKELCKEMNKWTNEFLEELKMGIKS